MFLVAVFLAVTTRMMDWVVVASVAMSRMEEVRLNESRGKGDGMNLLHPTSDFYAVAMMGKPLVVVDLRKLVCYCYSMWVRCVAHLEGVVIQVDSQIIPVQMTYSSSCFVD